jgi:hypothetical protein
MPECWRSIRSHRPDLQRAFDFDVQLAAGVEAGFFAAAPPMARPSRPLRKLVLCERPFSSFANALLDAAPCRAGRKSRKSTGWSPIQGALRGCGAALCQTLLGPIRFAVVVEDEQRLMRLSTLLPDVG